MYFKIKFPFDWNMSCFILSPSNVKFTLNTMYVVYKCIAREVLLCKFTRVFAGKDADVNGVRLFCQILD